MKLFRAIAFYFIEMKDALEVFAKSQSIPSARVFIAA
jgi:hypothetical protein